jgi:hypothetical protein
MEILDMLEELESFILQAKKPLFTNNPNIVAINKQELIDSIDMIKKMINEKYRVLRNKLQESELPKEITKADLQILQTKISAEEYPDEEAREIIKKAKKEALQIKQEIDDFSLNVIKNLKLAVTKCRGRLVKFDTIIDMTKERMEKTAHFAELDEEEIEL